MEKREIKFRAWDSDAKKMVEFDYGRFSAVDGTLKYYAMVPFKLGGKLELMQYTGLKDKNGKEIYEGDIVYFDKQATGKENWNDEPKVIIWNGREARFDFENSFNGLIYRNYEILGNIYQNPELLS